MAGTDPFVRVPGEQPPGWKESKRQREMVGVRSVQGLSAQRGGTSLTQLRLAHLHKSAASGLALSAMTPKSMALMRVS